MIWVCEYFIGVITEQLIEYKKARHYISHSCWGSIFTHRFNLLSIYYSTYIVLEPACVLFFSRIAIGETFSFYLRKFNIVVITIVWLKHLFSTRYELFSLILIAVVRTLIFGMYLCFVKIITLKKNWKKIFALKYSMNIFNQHCIGC